MASLNFKQKNHGFKRNSGYYRFILPVIIVIALVAILLFSMGGVNTISQTQTLSLTQGTASQLKLTSSAVFSMYLSSVSSSSAEISISQSPVLLSTIVSFSILSGQTLNVSTYASNNANLQIKLLSSNASTAKLQLTPVPTGLTIPISPGLSSSQPSSLPQTGVSGNTTQSTTILSTTTTISNQNTSKTTSVTTVATGASTSQVTTTSPNQNIPSSVVSAAENSDIGKLVANLDTLYAEESQCTPSLYNQTLLSKTGQSATGAFSYANASAITPSTITSVITGPVYSNYTVVYSSKSNSKLTTGTAISLILNGTTGIISNIKFSGIFEGQNYTDIENSYNYQNSIGNACAAYIPQ